MSLLLQTLRDDGDAAVPGVGTGATAQRRHEAALEGLAARRDDAVALSLTVPFCATHCMSCPRDTRVAQPAAVIGDYVGGLVDEFRNLAGRIGGTRDVLQLHLGHGTANELNQRQLAWLVGEIRQTWRIGTDTEMSVDCDPRRASWTQLELLRGLGFNRVNFGVLDLDPEVQQAIGRQQSVDLIDDVCDLARNCGIEIINLDVMVGLPRQTRQGWQTTLDRLLVIAPDRVRLAHYRHRPWQAPAQQTIDAEALPDAGQTQALARQTVSTLCAAGYRWIGADQFVLEDDALAQALDEGRLRRNRIAYTACPPAPLLGIGAAAVSEIDDGVFWNEASLPAWRQRVRAGGLSVVQAWLATAHDLRRRAAVERLQCGLELPFESIRDGLEDGYLRLARHAAQGSVRVLEDRIVVTDTGRHALAELCSELYDPWAASNDEGLRHGW